MIPETEKLEACRLALGALKRLKARGELYSTDETRHDIEQIAYEAGLKALEAWVEKGRPGALSTFVYRRVQGDIIEWLRGAEGPIRKGATGLPRPKKGERPVAEPSEDEDQAETPARESEDATDPCAEHDAIDPRAEDDAPTENTSRPTEAIASINPGTSVLFGQTESETQRQIFGIPEEYLRKAFSPAELKAAIEKTDPGASDRELLRVWLAKGDLKAWAKLTGQTIEAVRGRLAFSIAPLYAILTNGKPPAEVIALSSGEIKAAYSGQAMPALVAERTRQIAQRLSIQHRKQSKMRGRVTRKGFANREDQLQACKRIVREFEFNNLDAARKRLPPEKRSRREREEYVEARSTFERMTAPAEDYEGGTSDPGAFADLFGN